MSEELKPKKKLIWEKAELHAEKKEEREKKFYWELENLDLTLQDLEKKKVLDVGCGDGIMPASLRKRGIGEAYGGDLEEIIKKYGLKDIKGFFVYDYGRDEPPVKNLDFIIAHACLHPEASEENLKNVNYAIPKLVEALNNRGEIRIWPAYPQDRWIEILDKLYSELPQNNKFEYEFKENERGKRKKEKNLGDEYNDTYLVLRKKRISKKVSHLP